MALDERYIPLTSLNQYFVDKDTGEPLAGGTIEFFKNTAQSTNKPVYELTGTPGSYSYTALDNPVTLSAVGTAQNAGGDNVVIYAYPYDTDADGNLELDLYYVVCKDSDGNTQWTRQAVPHLNESNDPASDISDASNLLSNPQFTRYFLEDSATALTVSSTNQTFPIAPDWEIVASGSGTVTVTRTPVAGNTAIPTYPAYYLSIQVGSGVTACALRQRLDFNSGLWSGEFVSGFFVAKAASGSNAATMKYKDSSGSTNDVDIFDATIDSSWKSFGGSVEIGDSSNTQSGDNAYVDIELELPLSNTTDVTSLQILVSDNELGADISNYEQRPANREQALMGDWYIPRIGDKPIPSFLVGWDFPLNPAQFGASGTLTAGAGNTDYIWDQTIAQTLTGDLTYGRSSLTTGLECTTNADDQAFCLIQYLDMKVVNKFIGSKLSVNVNAWKTAAGDDATIRVYLFRGTAASAFPSLSTIIGTLNTDGTFDTPASGWAEIPRSNLPTAKATLKEITANNDINSGVDYGFNGWQITDSSQLADTNKFAIVVTCVAPDSSSVITFNSISLVPGDIPTRPAPKTEEETLRDCEYYYEKSYQTGVNPGTLTAAGELVFMQGASPQFASGSTVGIQSPFDIRFKTMKRSVPTTFTVYNPTKSSTSNEVFATAYRTGGAIATASVAFSTNWDASTASTWAIHYTPKNMTTAIVTGTADATSGKAADIRLHYTADSRIGK